MGWISRVRERLWSRYGRLGLLGLVVAACVGFFLVGRAGRSGSDTKPSAGPAAKRTEPVRDVPPPPIAGSWAGDDGFGGKTLRIFREDGVFIERSAYGNARMGRWEALPDGVSVTLPDEPPVTGWFVNGALHLPSAGVPGVRRDPLVFERQPPPARPQ